MPEIQLFRPPYFTVALVAKSVKLFPSAWCCTCSCKFSVLKDVKSMFQRVSQQDLEFRVCRGQVHRVKVRRHG